jgi:hypothetical protein
MSDRALKVCLAIGAMCVFASSAAARGSAQAGGGKYQVVKVCSLLSLAEVKKLAPWPPHLDQFAKGEEEPIGTGGSSCNYPTVFIQVMAFNQSFIDNLKKTGVRLEPVSGVGELAYVRNNKDRYAELVGKVGPHSLTVQLSIESNKTFDSTRPSLIAIGKAYADKLR